MAEESKSPPSYRYPLKKLDKSDDYLKIEIIEYNPPGLGNQPGSFALNTADQTYKTVQPKDIKGTILLPIPDNLQNSNAVGWGPNTINPIDAALLSGATQGITNPKEILGKVLGGLKSAVGFTLTEQGQSAVIGAMGGLAAKALGGGVPDTSTIINRQTGFVANQNLELLFSGVGIRPEFSFSYDLIPRSKDEGEIIKKIIRLFKYHSSARKGSPKLGPGVGIFLSAPNVFRLTYMSGNNKHPFLNRFKICALIAMNVDYAAAGPYSTYPDATPTHMKMSLTFKELTPIYAEDYTDQDVGVGY